MKLNLDQNVPGDLLIESSIDAMIAIGTDEHVTVWNRAATFLFDRSREKAMGKPLQIILPSLKEDADFLLAIQWAKKGKKSYLAANTAFAHRRHVETHIIPMHTGDNVYGVMILLHDVSHRIAKEQELQQLNNELQKRLRQLQVTTRDLAELTHITTHNIRTPIRLIYTAIEGLIQSEAKTMSNSGRASFRRMQSSLNRMNLLLEDIVTLTQISLADPPDSMINVEELVQDIRKQFDQKIRQNKLVLTTGELCAMRAHRNQVLLLLQHILLMVMRSNAPEQPHINISCTKVSHNGNGALNSRPGEYYLLSFTHNGEGFTDVKASIAPEITQPNADWNNKGTAIASVITFRVMEAHAGFFTLEKKENGDTTINCFFPA